VFVFLLLAAMYESWRLPWAVLLGSPLVALGAFFGVWLTGSDNNVYVQVGLIMLIGLAAKNAILIVEFANQRRDAGLPFDAALVEAAQVRLRPILMTSVATVLGVLPLVFASGAGAEARENLGVVVCCGLLFATALTLFMVPAFYSVLARRSGSPGRTAAELARQIRTPP
jgi:multidrug efflux pump